MEPVHNARIKRYPDGSAELLIGSQPFGGGEVRRDPAGAGYPVFPRRRWVPASSEEDAYADLERDAIAQGDDVRSVSQDVADAQRRALMRSVRRAKKVVHDLARSNEWTYFVTLTLDPEKVNRYDPVEVLKHLRHWLGNNVRRRGLRYLLVLEHHKDGAIHGHGLINDALEAVDSGTMSVPGRKAPVKVRSEAHRKALERAGGHVVYNLPGWGWGFSTAIHLYGEMDAAINYVCKYIGKEMDGTNVRSAAVDAPFTGKIGGRWYYSGGDLQRPTVEWFDVDPRDWEGYQGWFSPAALPGTRFLALRVTAGGEVLDPYVRPGSEDAEHVRGSNQPLQTADCDCLGPSTGHAAVASDDSPSGPVSPGEDASTQAALYASGPPGPGCRYAGVARFTFSGLLSGGETPGVEGPEAPPGQNDP